MVSRRTVIRASSAALAGALAPVSSPFQRAALAITSPVAAAPPTAYIGGDRYVETYKQKWALSCEYAATHTALRLMGHHVTEDVMRALLGRGEDPDETFRGEIQANQTLDDYGVHAKGIARLIELLKARGHLPADMRTRLLYDLESMRQALAAGEPVIGWLPLSLRASSRAPVRLSNGKLVNLVYSEHCVTFRGYDSSRMLTLEPYDGSTPSYEFNALWRGMSLFDDPALAVGYAPAAPPAPPPVPTSETFAESGVTLDGGFYRLYRELGGRETLGAPITPEFHESDGASESGKQVVYTEMARLEWNPTTGTFGLGFVGQDLLGEQAQPDPNRRLGGAISRYFAEQGGLQRFGYSISEEVPFGPEAQDLFPRPMQNVIGQWFQTGLLLWSQQTGVVPGRAGMALAKHRG
ncbi:MAG TPA: C39 family peptidase, partial [Chloroflexota bacterium]|nr:C39 family peptidase [Chloroflexota bacterium]